MIFCFLLLKTIQKIVRNYHRNYITILNKKILIKEIKYHARIGPPHKIPKIPTLVPNNTVKYLPF